MEAQAVTTGQRLAEQVQQRIELVLQEGNTPRRIICRGEDLRSLAWAICRWAPTVSTRTFWGVPICPLEPREALRVWGLLLVRFEDAEMFAEAARARGLHPMIEPIRPGECFILAEQGQGRAG